MAEDMVDCRRKIQAKTNPYKGIKERILISSLKVRSTVAISIQCNRRKIVLL